MVCVSHLFASIGVQTPESATQPIPPSYLEELNWLFYFLATSKTISRQVPTCDNVHSWRFYNAAILEDHTTGTMT